MTKITPVLVRKAFAERKLETQKWDYGHCLVIAGSKRLLGAAVLTTKAALRGGAGLVTLATPRSLQMLVYSQVLEALTLGLDESEQGTIDVSALASVETYIKERGVTAVTVGPGLTRQAVAFVHQLVSHVALPMVLDADAINVAPPLTGSALRCLTPHRKEFSRLVNVTEKEVMERGPVLAAQFAKSHPNAILVLKGYHSKIFYGSQAWENTTGNPGMAKGGSGDVLSGLMGAFLAQKAAQGKLPESYLEAILSAVYLHGLAGDLAAKELSQTAMNAEDIVDFLPKAIKQTLKR
ncbi:MAG: NAD(P)H-hydrate dehydratase [Elusimicrobia bacterium]|nr:NAD(P)H-hydrate dehydratase [Elusimicrobiota bacterium]